MRQPRNANVSKYRILDNNYYEIKLYLKIKQNTFHFDARVVCVIIIFEYLA